MEIYEQQKPNIAKWIVFTGLLALFVLDIVLVTTGNAGWLDKPFLDGFVAMRNAFLTGVVKAITFCADTRTIIVLCIVLLILPTRARFGVPVTILVSLSSLLNVIFKAAIGRARPDEAIRLIDIASHSFPSGHANAGFVTYILLMILLRRYFFLRNNPGIAWFATTVLSLLAFGIGLSRIYLGVHYPTDVFGGWLLAGMMLILFMSFYEIYYPQKWILTYHQPAWQMIRKRRPWKRPARPNREIPLVEFPTASPEWRDARVTPQRETDGEPNRLLQENQPPDPARERRRAQIQRMREQQKKK